MAVPQECAGGRAERHRAAGAGAGAGLGPHVRVMPPALAWPYTDDASTRAAPGEAAGGWRLCRSGSAGRYVLAAAYVRTFTRKGAESSSYDSRRTRFSVTRLQLSAERARTGPGPYVWVTPPAQA